MEELKMIPPMTILSKGFWLEEVWVLRKSAHERDSLFEVAEVHEKGRTSSGFSIVANEVLIDEAIFLNLIESCITV